MKIALTGATGFIGRYIAADLIQHGHNLRCWYRPTSDRGGFEHLDRSIQWVEGDLGRPESCPDLVAGCDAVVHAALHHPGGGFRGGGGDVIEFVENNVVGTIRLIEASRRAAQGGSCSSLLVQCMRRSSTAGRSMKPIPFGRPAIMEHIRRRSKSLFTAMGWAMDIRFAPAANGRLRRRPPDSAQPMV